MSAVLRLSPQTYLEQERLSETKHEFCNGEVFAMSGASYAHNVITANIIRELGNQLKQRPCRVLPSDMRVRVEDGFVYPDVSVVCGKPEFYDKDNLCNPSVIVEVLSPSTADYDANGKFARYRQLASLQEYLLVAQDRPHLLHYVRQAENRWLLSEYRGAVEFELPNIGCRLDLTEVYANVLE